MGHRAKVLIVDLNNFSMYPTIAVGYLVSALRTSGHEVSVFSPLSLGINGVVREPKQKPWSLLKEKAKFSTALSSSKIVKGFRNKLKEWNSPDLSHEIERISQEFEAVLKQEHDVVLVSTYLMYFPLCEKIGEICSKNKVPLLIGGPYFSQHDVAKYWMGIKGLTALVGGEVELQINDIIQRIIEKKELNGISGIWDSNGGTTAAPLRNLNDIPFPDYTDFPWQKYPNKIIPLISGRGCGWGKCTFCSDITSSAGRTFRQRSVGNVTDELRHQSEKHDAKMFVFTDLKLNSDTEFWNGLISKFQSAVPNASWIASVHIGNGTGEFLDQEKLDKARAAGAVRLTTGLESGSQRILDKMNKGTQKNNVSSFLKSATQAGISVRTTMILGYPGETADDVLETCDFVTEHQDSIERISLNRFQIMTGTIVDKAIRTNPEEYQDLGELNHDHRMAQTQHQFGHEKGKAYKKAVFKLLEAVHAVNKKDLMPSARAFEGVM